MHEFIIIGTGITGLALGRFLSAKIGADSVVLLEKSKGLGGRLATRRGESTRFDHGSPEIPSSILDMLGISEADFAFEGATSLAKHIARGLRVEKNQRVSKLIRVPSQWILNTDEGKTFEAGTLILTAPLPQALELLRNNGIAYPARLTSVNYEMAIVALLTGSGLDETHSLLRFQNSDFLSLTNEKMKGISDNPAWTLTFSAAWSKNHFEAPDDSLRELALKAILQKWPEFKGSIEIKKWRYSRPESSVPAYFEKLTDVPALYLAGDAFSPKETVPGMERSIRSAQELFKRLQSG